MKAKNLFEKIPDILLAQLASFSIVYGLTSSLCLSYPPIKIFLLVILCIMVLFVLLYNKKSSIAAYAFLGVTFTAIIIYIAFGIGMNRCITFLKDYFYWLEDFIQYPGIPEPLYQNITVTALCIIISIFSYIFIIRKFLFLVILAAGMGLFTIQSSYSIVITYIPFYIFLLVGLIAWLKHVYALKSSKSPNGFSKSPTMIIWSIPICLIIFTLAYSLHASEKPIVWEWLDKKVVSVYNYINKNFNYEVFDYFSLSASSGFGDRDNLLGGRVRLDKTNVLEVTTSKNVYLKGATKEMYTGHTWLNRSQKEYSMEDNDASDSFYSDTEEMLLGMFLLTGKGNFIEDYFDKNQAEVTFMNLKTKSLFIPSKVADFVPWKDDFVGFRNDSNDLFSSEKLTKGFNYNVEMYSPRIGTEEFANELRKSKRGLYNGNFLKLFYPDNTIFSLPINFYITKESTTLDTSAPVVISDIEDKLLSLRYRSEQIYRDYLQLPSGLPQRVKDLSASLVASCHNNYDKAKVIEEYLSSNYPYNLDVRSTPRNRDFVDYFLFDLKQGYCSYFASAMVVLARCADLPARYVEGYMLPPEPTEEYGSTYIVTNMQAHAWVEIYFEGYGWLPFEPTAPFRSDFYLNESSEPVYASGYSSYYDEYMNMMEMYSDHNDLNIDVSVGDTQDKTSTMLFVFISSGTVIFLFTILLLFNIFRRRFRLYKLINLPAKECVLNFYNYYIYVLGLQELGYRTAETPFQYSERIDSFLLFSPVKFKVITDIFVKSRYSTKDATEKEKQLFCDFHDGFMEEVKINMGKFRYFVYKYILGRF